MEWSVREYTYIIYSQYEAATLLRRSVRSTRYGPGYGLKQCVHSVMTVVAGMAWPSERGRAS